MLHQWPRDVIGLVVALTLGTATAVSGQKITRATISVDGADRTYHVFMPEGTDAVPLVVLLHGSGRDGPSIIRPWESLAKSERIALVAPDSRDRQGWNLRPDGPAFFHALVESIRKEGRIDPRRMYLFGHSAGGHHSIDLGLLESQYFAAVAVHAGALTHDHALMTASAVRRIPIAKWNGTDDRIVPLAAVRQSRDYLISQGFDVKLTEVVRHTHDYYGISDRINKAAWDFLKTHKLSQDPIYKEYAIGK